MRFRTCCIGSLCDISGNLKFLRHRVYATLGWSKYNIAQAGGYFYVKLKVEDTSNVSVGDTFTYVYRCRASTIVYNLVPLSSPGIIAPQASEEYQDARASISKDVTCVLKIVDKNTG